MVLLLGHFISSPALIWVCPPSEDFVSSPLGLGLSSHEDFMFLPPLIWVSPPSEDFLFQYLHTKRLFIWGLMFSSPLIWVYPPRRTSCFLHLWFHLELKKGKRSTSTQLGSPFKITLGLHTFKALFHMLVCFGSWASGKLLSWLAFAIYQPGISSQEQVTLNSSAPFSVHSLHLQWVLPLQFVVCFSSFGLVCLFCIF